MKKEKHRIIAEVDPTYLDLLAEQDEISKDACGRYHGVGRFIARCARRFNK